VVGETAQHREEAMFRGYTVVDPATVVTTHLTEIVKDNMAELLSYAETQKLLDELEEDQQKLVADLIPARRSRWAACSGAAEPDRRARFDPRSADHPGGDLRSVRLHAVGHGDHRTRAGAAGPPDQRGRGQRAWRHPAAHAQPRLGADVRRQPGRSGDDKQLAMAPSRLQEFIVAVRTAFERHAMMGESPVLLTSPAARPYVRSIVDRFRPSTVVMSQNEIAPKARIKTLGQV
jgi:flagellar biosynthesis protein FlhA